jgi:hypothetical protein
MVKPYLCLVFLLASFHLQEEDKEVVLHPPFGSVEVVGSWRRAPASRKFDIDFAVVSLVGNNSSNKFFFH